VPRRSFSFLAATIGRLGYRVCDGIAARLRRFDHADRFLGFEAPTVIVLTLAALLGSFTVVFGLMLLPWAGTAGEAMRESGSSIFTLGFVSTAAPDRPRRPSRRTRRGVVRRGVAGGLTDLPDAPDSWEIG
jgi:hypothetical protein